MYVKYYDKSVRNGSFVVSSIPITSIDFCFLFLLFCLCSLAELWSHTPLALDGTMRRHNRWKNRAILIWRSNDLTIFAMVT